MVFSDSNIEVFTVFNKVFVVSFFRNLAFWKILSAKAIKFALWFWYILPIRNQFDIFLHVIEGKSIELVQNQGLHFFFIASIMRKNARNNASFLGLYF